MDEVRSLLDCANLVISNAGVEILDTFINFASSFLSADLAFQKFLHKMPPDCEDTLVEVLAHPPPVHDPLDLGLGWNSQNLVVAHYEIFISGSPKNHSKFQTHV